MQRLIPGMLQRRSMFQETELVGHGAEIPLLSDLLHTHGKGLNPLNLSYSLQL